MRIQNNSRSALSVADIKIPARASAEVPDWNAALKSSPVLRAWVRAKILAEVPAEAPAPTVVAEPYQAPEDPERAELFAALAELGVHPGGRTSTWRLRSMLQESKPSETPAPTEE